MKEEIKRWTAKSKTALILEILQGKTKVSEAYLQKPNQWIDALGLI
ncbi:hypothetical protein [Lampropedia aestuarii]